MDLRSGAASDAARLHLRKAPVAQRIEHLTTDQKVRGSNPFGRAPSSAVLLAQTHMGHQELWHSSFETARVMRREASQRVKEDMYSL